MKRENIVNVLQEENLQLSVIHYLLKFLPEKEMEKAQFLNEAYGLLQEMTSYYLFPNHICQFYPFFESYESSYDLTCHISGQPILKH